MATITTSDELRLFNRSRVLSCLRNSSQSRTKISELTGLSGATVTQVTADLIDDGIVEKTSPVAGAAGPESTNARRGRPQVTLELRAKAATTAVISLLLNRVEVTLFDYVGNELHRKTKTLVTADLSVKTLKNNLLALLDKALLEDQVYRDTLKHIAVVYQGIVSSDNKQLLWSPITSLRDFDLAEFLQNKYGVGVTVLNDCKTMASALYQVHRSGHKNGAVDPDNFAVLMLSYGIGLGLFHQGSILTGSHSSGTEFGHMLLKPGGALCRCGRNGCIEAYASDYAIWRSAMGHSDTSAPADEISAVAFKDLIDKANASDGPERKAFSDAGSAIGVGLANLYALIDPCPVVLVGTSTAAYELMEESLHKNLSHFGEESNTRSLISVHETKSESALILEGASMLALTYIDREIFGFGQPVDSAHMAVE